MDLAQKVAIVTGASQGIGREIASEMAAAGARVVICARRAAEVEAVAAEIRKRGGEAVAVAADVADDAAVQRVVGTAVDRYGTVDILVNNAGVAGAIGPFWEISPDDWRQCMDINVTGPWLLSRAVVPLMAAKREGRIINIGSITGKRPLPNRSPYCASKMALLGLTRSLALEVGPQNITVNCISPGAVNSPRLEMLAKNAGMPLEELLKRAAEGSALERVCQPSDVAALCVFLAGPGAANITGQDINVDAGTFMD